MQSSRVPPMSVFNELDIIPTADPELQLENNLITMRIIFQKIFYLPKSRWTGLKDRVINIPINKENVLNTVENFQHFSKGWIS